MTISKQDVGKEFYFVDKINRDGSFCVEKGTLLNIIPKYNFQDAFGSAYNREQSILFTVKYPGNTEKTKAISNENLIFVSIDDVINYDKQLAGSFGYSVVINQK